jgi:hypothetical protein
VELSGDHPKREGARAHRCKIARFKARAAGFTLPQKIDVCVDLRLPGHMWFKSAELDRRLVASPRARLRDRRMSLLDSHGGDRCTRPSQVAMACET